MTQKAVLVVLLLLPFLASPGRAVTGCSCPAGCQVCEPLQVGMDASLSKSVLEYGESADVSILARNSEPNLTTLGCSYSVLGTAGAEPNVTNDGEWHLIGLVQVTAPQAIVEHQVGVNVPAEVNCTASISNQTGLAWCGSGCSSFVLMYVYPSSESIAEHRGAQLDAVNKLSLARTAVSKAESMIAKAESVGSTSPYFNSSREKLAIADGFLTSASFMYDQLDFSLSSSNSESAIAYAWDAEILAYLAYGMTLPATTYSYVLRLIEETQRQGGSMSEDIAKITDTMTIAGTSGVGIGGPFKNILERERKNIEEANRLLEEARKRLREGNYTGAAESALSAKTLVEKAREVLHSAFSSVRNGFLTALERARHSLFSEIDWVSARIDGLATQTWVNLEEIKFGRTDLGYARYRMTKASALIGKVADAQNLPELLKSSSDALLELRSARGYVEEARFHAYLSMLRKYMAVAVVSGGAALLAALVWWIEKRKEAHVETAGPAAHKTGTEPVGRGKPRKVSGKRQLRLPKPVTGKSLPGRRSKKPSMANQMPAKFTKAGKQRPKRGSRKTAGAGTKRKPQKRRK